MADDRVLMRARTMCVCGRCPTRGGTGTFSYGADAVPFMKRILTAIDANGEVDRLVQGGARRAGRCHRAAAVGAHIRRGVAHASHVWQHAGAFDNYLRIRTNDAGFVKASVCAHAHRSR